MARRYGRRSTFRRRRTFKKRSFRRKSFKKTRKFSKPDGNHLEKIPMYGNVVAVNTGDNMSYATLNIAWMGPSYDNNSENVSIKDVY